MGEKVITPKIKDFFLRLRKAILLKKNEKNENSRGGQKLKLYKTKPIFFFNYIFQK
jgi:hypothetical protein